MGDVENTVKKLIMEELGVEEENVSTTARFVDDLVIDSMSSMALAVNFEEAFNIEMSEEAMDKIKTVGELVQYIKDRL